MSEAIRRIRRFPLRRRLHKGLDAHFVRFIEAPLYKHAADATTAVFGMDVEDREHYRTLADHQANGVEES